MKPYLLLLLTLTCTGISVSAQERAATARLSAGTRKYLKQIERHDRDCPFRPEQDGRPRMVTAMIRVLPSVDTAGLNRLGVETGTRAGNIWTVRIPAGRVPELTRVGGIDYIQIDTRETAPKPAD